MNKLIILLKQLNIIEDVNVLLHASLKKVIVHHDNHYTFYILSKDLIPFTEYQLLLDHGLDFPYLAEFVICYDDFNFESKDVSLYLGYIIEKLKQISPLFSSLKIEDIEIKQTISIGLLNEIQLEQFQQLKSTIKKYFVEIGIEKDFSFYVKQDNDELNHLLQEMDSYEPMKIDMSEIKKSEPVKPTVDYKNNYRKAKGDATFLKLSEINSQTMENNCTIQGYVFKTELIKTRAGKHIQTLWITDYTDSIMVKRFENNTTNTLEDIKVLDKGKVWIKATGEIRLDNYARETVMMARQIEVIKEPARRQDTVEVKRVELHTHSKMSAIKVDAVETPIGFLPKKGDINLKGIEDEVTSEVEDKLLAVDVDLWKKEIAEMRRYYNDDIKAKGGNIPQALFDELDKIEARLNKA